MSKQTKCPQCGIELFNEYYTPVVCPMCGWGKTENVTLTPPSNFAYKLSLKSPRWKASVVAGAFVMLLILTPLLNFGRNQLMANHAVAVAKTQMDKRLYASAARTLNEAPRSLTTDATRKKMNSLLSDNVRWAHDITDVNAAKASLVAVDPDEALDNLDNIDEDFPQEDEAVDLMDFAQDQSLDPDIEVSDDILDEMIDFPDDPELANIDDIAEEAQVEIVEPEDATNTQPSTPAAPTTPTETDPAAGETTPDDPADEVIPDDQEPDSPPPADTPATAPAAKAARLTPLYQLKWSKQGDQDNFYTIDFTNEVTPGKDKKSNFGGYGEKGAIGQIYNRKPANSPSIIPLYRYWSASKTNHYYATSSKFASSNANTNYVRQQVAGYIGKWDGQKCLAGTNPLYSLYSPSATNNLYTANADVKNNLLASKNWTNQKVVGCIW